MDAASAFRRCLDDLDVAGVRALWAQVSPHLPQPESDLDALTALHVARTQAESTAFQKRAYSHAWLCERNLPSHLPDHLKPSADRLYPRVVEAVGIAVMARNPAMKPIALELRKAMEDAVMDAHAHGKLSDSAFVSARMAEAREKRRMEILGRTGLYSISAGGSAG